MGKPKGSKNKIHSGIYYPRKCEYCDYESNNPSMFHYHHRTHNSLVGKICDHGCGASAVSVSTSGKYCCSESYKQCPGYIKLITEKITSSWENSDSVNRKEETKKSLIARLHNKETVDRMRNTKWAKWGMENATEEQWKEFRKYGRSCRALSQKWARDNGYETGPQTFHVDHIYSIQDGFTNKVSPLIMSHPANLRILEAKKNSSKGPKSEITLEQLLERINECS